MLSTIHPHCESSVLFLRYRFHMLALFWVQLYGATGANMTASFAQHFMTSPQRGASFCCMLVVLILLAILTAAHLPSQADPTLRNSELKPSKTPHLYYKISFTICTIRENVSKRGWRRWCRCLERLAQEQEIVLEKGIVGR